jgi:hypothetical protein
MTTPIFLAEPVTRVRWRHRPPAWCAVAAAHLLATLKPHRLRRVLELLRVGARPATAAETRQALDAVLASSMRCRGEYCLQRSIATALLCRIGGRWPELLIGARPRPFQAHAWVAAGGVPVGDLPEVIRGLGTLWVVSARGKGR